MFWNSLAKAVSTIMMWILLSTISILALVADSETTNHMVSHDGLVPLVIVPIIIALIGTFVIWGLPEIMKDKDTLKLGGQLDESGGKAKRKQGDKLALLMEMMDEDERQAFKTALQQRLLQETTANTAYDDGELPYDAETLESLLDDE
jgi:hypothetical protein